MWMIAPIPETKTSIVLLNWSNTRPSGTRNIPATSIQVISAAEISGRVKIKQLQTKLMSTAAIEIKLLSAFHRSVNKVITTALTSGASRMIQGTSEFIGLVARESRELTRMVQRDTSGEMTNIEYRRNDQIRMPERCIVRFRHSSSVLRHYDHSR